MLLIFNESFILSLFCNTNSYITPIYILKPQKPSTALGKMTLQKATLPRKFQLLRHKAKKSAKLL